MWQPAAFYGGWLASLKPAVRTVTRTTRKDYIGYAGPTNGANIPGQFT